MKAQKLRTVVEHFPLANVFDAYDLMGEGKLKGRAVRLPNGRACYADIPLRFRFSKTVDSIN
jgi:hypothetical protein